MGEFADLDDDMQDALDAAYGERVLVLPRVPEGLHGRPVPGAVARPPVEIVGRFRRRPVTSELEGNREGSKFQSMTRIAGAELALRVSPGEAGKLGYDLAPNDVVVLLDRPDVLRFTVTRVGPQDSGELMVVLTAGGAA